MYMNKKTVKNPKQLMNNIIAAVTQRLINYTVKFTYYLLHILLHIIRCLPRYLSD